MRTKPEMMGQLRPAFSELNISEGFEFDTEIVTNEVNNCYIVEVFFSLSPQTRSREGASDMFAHFRDDGSVVYM